MFGTAQKVSPNVLQEGEKRQGVMHAYIHLSGMAHGIVVEGAVTLQAAAGATRIGGEVPMRYSHIHRDPAKSAHCKNCKKERKES